MPGHISESGNSPARFSDWSRFDLGGRTALITGGAGLLGPEHAAALARCGARVVLVDVDESRFEHATARILEQVPEAEIACAPGSVTDETDLEKLRCSFERRGWPVEILVNNAALNPQMKALGSEPTGRVEDYDLAIWNKELEVGITGTFLCCKVFGSAMARAGKGVIVNIASDLAIQAPDQRVYTESERIEDVTNFKPVGYAVVKSALLGMTRYLATYWAHKGIRVNCLVPGAVFNDQPEHLVKNVIKRVPLARWAEKSDYQGPLAYLASDASAYMTGQILVVDGGRSIW